MMSDTYHRLRARLDDLATGFPATEDQVEIRLLKRLFTPEEADLFLKLSPMLETPDAVADRLGHADTPALAEALEQMAQKGLLFRLRRNDQVRYAAVPYVIGLYEYQIGRMDKDIAGDMEAYFETALGKTLQAYKTAQMRTVPVNRDVAARLPVAPYDDVITILEAQKTIAKTPCICRTTTTLNDKACDKPKENCLVFGAHADYYVENGWGQYITQEDAKVIARQSEEAGLVMQPFNSLKVGGMCSCCGCCCGILRSLKMQPSPADAVKSNYYVAVDDASCSGCETCVDRCEMDAIDMVDDIAAIDLKRCIGCGLCVTTCPEEALSLVQKPADQVYTPPASGMETYLNIASERGKI